VSDRAAAAPRIDGATAGDARGTFVQRVRVLVLVAVSWLACRLPESLLVHLAELAGELWYRATPRRAARARRNLDRVVRHLAETGQGTASARAAAGHPIRLERLVRSAYRHVARYYLDLIRLPALSGRTIDERLVVETPDVVEEAFAEDRPVIFVGLHFGAIELPALYLALRTGREATGPMETLADPELQRWFLRTRARAGVRIVGLREARRELLAAIRRGESVGLVGDRDITGGGMEVPFFGAPAPLPAGPALLAIESGAPLYVVGVRRDGVRGYRGQLRSVEVPVDGSRRERVTATVGHLARAFEASVAEAPDQWWAVFFPIWPDLEGDPA
jgi:phosphatidylinositol dimannoside acyltransferase